MGRASWSHNPQSTIRIPKTILKYYSEFYVFTISSIHHTYDLSLYAWFEIDTISVRTPEGCQNFRRFDIRFWRVLFNPYLPRHSTIPYFGRHLLQGTSVSIIRTTSLQGVFWKLFVSRRGMVFQQGRTVNDWEDNPFSSPWKGCRVESYDMMRKEREFR